MGLGLFGAPGFLGADMVSKAVGEQAQPIPSWVTCHMQRTSAEPSEHKTQSMTLVAWA